MSAQDINELKLELALQLTDELMKGWSPQDNPLEFDATRPDSQLSLNYESAVHAVNFVVDRLLSQEHEVEEDEDEDESIFDEYGHLKRKQTNTTSASLFIFMDAGTGNARYVSDVRKWLENVDKAGIPDDTEIEGQLYLDYDLNGLAENIECGECGKKNLIISTCGH
jgi:hypothetical protein